MSISEELLLIERIKRAVSEHFKLSTKDLLKSTRHPSISWPRQIAMAIACNKGAKPKNVSMMFGLERSNARHSVGAVADRTETSKRDRASVREISERI